MEETSIHIVKCGAYTPVGSKAKTTAGSIRVSFSGVQRHPGFEDETWEPVKIGFIEEIDEDLEMVNRFLEMIKQALKEAYQPIESIDTFTKKIPLILGLPTARPGIPDNLEEIISGHFVEVEYEINQRFDISTISKGHVSGLIAMEEAVKMISSGKIEYCFIGGVDSYYNVETLKWLEEIKRLHCSYSKNGFIPGEAASFCLLASQEAVEKYDFESLAKILATASEEEENIIKNNKMSTGTALLKALTQTLNHLPEGRKISKIYCTLNGERYYNVEQGYIIMSLQKYLENPTNFITPVGSCGDIGAASGPILSTLACESARRGYAEGPYVLLTTGSLEKERACALLELNINEEMRKKWKR